MRGIRISYFTAGQEAYLIAGKRLSVLGIRARAGRRDSSCCGKPEEWASVLCL